MQQSNETYITSGGHEDRVRYLHLVAAARVAALRPVSEQQVADVVRVTVDDEVDTTTFRRIVVEVSSDLAR